MRMTKRLLAISVAVWALVMLPALCMGGVIGHSCDCASEELCRHEIDCDDDPCGQLSSAPRQRGAAPDTLAHHTPIAAHAAAPVHSLGSLGRGPEAPPPPRQCAGIPFAPSDTPLLI